MIGLKKYILESGSSLLINFFAIINNCNKRGSFLKSDHEDFHSKSQLNKNYGYIPPENERYKTRISNRVLPKDNKRVASQIDVVKIRNNFICLANFS